MRVTWWDGVEERRPTKCPLEDPKSRRYPARAGGGLLEERVMLVLGGIYAKPGGDRCAEGCTIKGDHS